MTHPQPQQGQLLVCQNCGSARVNGPWCYLSTPKMALVSIVAEKLKPCPMCAALDMVRELRDHVMAIEKEMAPQVEEADPNMNPIAQGGPSEGLININLLRKAMDGTAS